MDKTIRIPGDPTLIESIVSDLKAKGIFDEFRHECLADVDTKSSCQNLSQRVDGYAAKFLSNETWNPELNKNEMRNKLRHHIDESGMLAIGADHVVEQVINPKIGQLFLPKIIEVVHQFLNEQNEKLNKVQQSDVSNSEESKDNLDSSNNKTKSTIIDPIADILSFSYAKPKTKPPNSVSSKAHDAAKFEKKREDTQLKGAEKAEKKKEDPQSKSVDTVIKIEKKKDDHLLKNTDAVPKGEEKVDNQTVSEKVERIISDLHQTENQEEDKISSIHSTEIATVVKDEDNSDADDQGNKSNTEGKYDEVESSEIDFEDEYSLPASELSTKSGETKETDELELGLMSNNLQKSQKDELKSDKSHRKNKLESSKLKKTKHASSKSPLSSSELKKESNKDSKVPPLKISKSSVNLDSSHKSSSSSNSAKADKESTGVKGQKEGSKASEFSDHKSGTASYEFSLKKAHSSDKHKSSDSQHQKGHDSPTISGKAYKSSLQYSSSYDSSQGSDQDRSSMSSRDGKDKQKHFSKHHKKEQGSPNSQVGNSNATVDKKQQSDSDSGTPKKHKPPTSKKQSLSGRESFKISSRSNSCGSVSSASDSQASTTPSASDDVTDASSKSSEKKKKASSKEPCGGVRDLLPPPPPPPPSSSIAASSASADSQSSVDEARSSPETDSCGKSAEEDSSSESDEDDSYSSSTLQAVNINKILKAPVILNDIYDVFLYSSSSSEFEGYCSSAECATVDLKRVSDASVSSVHTSDLSSFNDEISDSDSEQNMGVPRLTIQEAQRILQERARQRQFDIAKAASYQKSIERRSTNSYASPVASLADCTSPPSEAKRESRRERKLNPKYASSEYTSIFNSKKRNFLTKQAQSTSEKSISPAKDSLRGDSMSPFKDTALFNKKSSVESSRSVHDSPSPRGTHSFSYSVNEAFKCMENSIGLSGMPRGRPKEDAPSRNSTMVTEPSTLGRIALKIRKSSLKSDSETNKSVQGVKRTLADSGEKPSKKSCHHDSNSMSSSDGVSNENEPINNRTKSVSSLILTIDSSDSKDRFRVQKVNNNGDVLNKLDHSKNNRKKLLPPANHVTDGKVGD